MTEPKTPEEIFPIEYWQKHPVTYSEVIEAMEIFAESSTKELREEITQLKEVNESLKFSNNMLTRGNIGMLKEAEELKAKLGVSKMALEGIIAALIFGNNEADKGLIEVAETALTKINT